MTAYSKMKSTIQMNEYVCAECPAWMLLPPSARNADKAFCPNCGELNAYLNDDEVVVSINHAEKEIK